MENNKWETMKDILNCIRDAYDNLESGKSSTEHAHAQARLLNAAQKSIALSIEHARLTGRLEQGSSGLPDFEINKNK